MHYGELISDKFVPDWYNAYCVNNNTLVFKNKPESVLKYIHNSINITDSEKVNIAKHYTPKPNSNILPYTYIFGEFRLTYKPTGEKILIRGRKRQRYKTSGIHNEITK